MRRPLVKAFNPPEAPPSVDVLIDRLQVAAIALGENKVRGSDYARAVAAASLAEARARLRAAIAGEAPPLPLSVEPDASHV